MILDSSEEVLPEACWNGRKEAESLVIGVALRLGQAGVIFFRNGMDQLKNQNHCSEPRNTTPKFPNDNLSSAIPLPRHTHIQPLRGGSNAQPPRQLRIE